MDRELLAQRIAASETWLVHRVVEYAKLRGYARYTSTLEEAWRQSIAGLSEPLIAALRRSEDLELGPDDDVPADSTAAFGILEAQRHRARGVTFEMFLGLMKYYRQSYVDLVAELLSSSEAAEGRLFVDRFFDHVELGFSSEWIRTQGFDSLAELQATNRTMTNEKNRYLTIFESLPDPVLFLDERGGLRNLNHAASDLFGAAGIPGAVYYAGAGGAETLPALIEQLQELLVTGAAPQSLQRLLSTTRGPRQFELRFKRMLDISGKFAGMTIFFHDITERERLIADLQSSLRQVKTLSGLIPICASCKKIRNDEGFWQQVEVYVRDHSDADFTHGICPECADRLYPDDEPAA